MACWMWIATYALITVAILAWHDDLRLEALDEFSSNFKSLVDELALYFEPVGFPIELVARLPLHPCCSMPYEWADRRSTDGSIERSLGAIDGAVLPMSTDIVARSQVGQSDADPKTYGDQIDIKSEETKELAENTEVAETIIKTYQVTDDDDARKNKLINDDEDDEIDSVTCDCY
ncbi:hypothetical protein B5X24_HaOG203724 [Helicoverpa armigera]|uniref:Uncharacterized protein n=1 Tax=Helicoverpa armigera TaxID=29058 RepID=A0A2W1BV84_HELAM|nr:hypothetical protein B5X24_HaOG203724 [Helicoverpa armigera]